MSTLLVDIGNTRIKWSVLRGAHIGRVRARAHRGKATALATLVRAVPTHVERVVAVCVAGAKFERALSAAARVRFGVRVEFVRSTRNAGGVRNGYRETWRLGADRWVGVIAAHAIAGARPVLVVNVGTALTLDAVSADGRHRGGAIAPGPDTMIASLLQGTHGIRRRARGARPRGARVRGLFASDTASAIEAGALNAAGALVDRAVVEARALGARPWVLLTGGGAGRLRTHIKSAVRVVPDLVLRGLAVLAQTPG